MVDKTSVSHFMVKNTSLKETDGKEKFKRMLSFLNFSGQRRLFFTKLSFEEFEIFITADRSAWPILKGNQAAKFRRVFWYISLHSIVKKITGFF